MTDLPYLPLETVKSRIADTVKIMAKLDEWYKPEEMLQFMDSEHPQLNGETPISAITNGRADEVCAIIDRLNSGVYL